MNTTRGAFFVFAIIAAGLPVLGQDPDAKRQEDINAPPLQVPAHQLPAREGRETDMIYQPRSTREVDQAVEQLGHEESGQRKALEDEYEERRRELVESPEYKALSRRERKAKVRALKNEFRVREQQLEDGYESRRREFDRQRRDVDDGPEQP